MKISHMMMVMMMMMRLTTTTSIVVWLEEVCVSVLFVEVKHESPITFIDFCVAAPL